MKHIFSNFGFQAGKLSEDTMEQQSAETRYDYTLQMLSRGNSVWCLLDAERETVTLDFQDCVHVCIWPSKEAAQKYAELTPEQKSIPYEITIEEFRKTTRELASDPQYRYAVYPTNQDLWIIEPETLLSELEDTERQLVPEQQRRSDKHLEHVWAAAPEKRYENFVHTAADSEVVWMIGDAQGELLCEIASCQCVCIWPEKAFAERYQTENLRDVPCTVFPVELERFLDQAYALPEEISFSVFPTGTNDQITNRNTLLCDLQEELENY